MKNLEGMVKILNDESGPEDQLEVTSMPWWRVVLSAGKISHREKSSSEYIQADRLRLEGVEVLKGHLVDLDELGWFPEEVDFD